jgi:hypothetical protein
MRLYSHAVLIAALAIPAFCQEPAPGPAAQSVMLADQKAQLDKQAELLAIEAQSLSDEQVRAIDKLAAQIDSGKFAEAEAKAAAAMEKFHNMPDIDFKLDQLNFQFDSGQFDDMTAAAADLANANMAFFQNPQPRPFSPAAPPTPKAMLGRRGDAAYDAGIRDLDQHKYDEAVQNFDAAINTKSPRAEGALYWKAWALNREGKRDEALASLGLLRHDYASSPWLKDAQGLEAEVKQNAGQPVSPGQEANDDIKLLAINGLMNADAERAIPLVEGILKGNVAPNVKDRALFVLAENKSSRAQQVLVDYAKGSGNPDLQLRAIQYVGTSGTKESQQILLGIYSSSTDARVKNTILQALMSSHANDALMNIAKSEKDASLRDSAIRYMVSNKSAPVDGLLDLYASSDAQAKRAIVDGFMSRRDGKTLVDLARKETDPAMKKYIVERLSTMHDNKDAMDYMIELLK